MGTVQSELLTFPVLSPCVLRPANCRALLNDLSPIKGVYFFPGNSRSDWSQTYTSFPFLPEDLGWNNSSHNRETVMQRMVDAHVNTVVMSYWGDEDAMRGWSPMDIGTGAQVIDQTMTAMAGKPLVMMPALESGFDSDHPEYAHWQVVDATAQSLATRVLQVANVLSKYQSQWARVYDRAGTPRFAVELIHAASNVAGTAPEFASLLQQAAQIVRDSTSPAIDVGFFLDPVPGIGRVTPTFDTASYYEAQPAILGIQGFEGEVFSGKIINGSPPYDNNVTQLPAIADWKRDALRRWVATPLPVIADVSNGYDARFVFGCGKLDAHGNLVTCGFWGDNFNYTDDRWRNWVSEMKGGGVKGIVVDTWNGYTEGYAVVPTRSHGSTVREWFTDLLEPDPRYCDHMHYVNFQASHRVYGAICEKWVALGADRGFGAPTTEEGPTGPTGQAGRVSYFENGKGIWFGAPNRAEAYELHGQIYSLYVAKGGASSYLGLPLSDESSSSAWCAGGRYNAFEHGWIDWCPDGRVWAHSGASEGYPGH